MRKVREVARANQRRPVMVSRIAGSIMVAVLSLFAFGLFSPNSALADQATCDGFWVDVDFLGIQPVGPWGGNYIFVKRCRPKNMQSWPTRAQLLGHGSGNRSTEFESQKQTNNFSYIEAVAKKDGAKYVTVQIDRPGTGLSSHPASADVSVPLVAHVFAQIAAMIKDGTLDDNVVAWQNEGAHDDMPAVPAVLYSGKSLGTGYGWFLDRYYPGAVEVLAGSGAEHDTPLYWIANIVGPHFNFPAAQHNVVQDLLSTIPSALTPGSGQPIDALGYDPTGFNPLVGLNSGMGQVCFDEFDPTNVDPLAPYGWHTEAFVYEQGSHPQMLKEGESGVANVSSYLVAQSAALHATTIVGTPCSGPNPSDSCYITAKYIAIVAQNDDAVCGQPSFGTLWMNDPITGQGPGVPGVGLDCSGTKTQTATNFHALYDQYYQVPPEVVVVDGGHHWEKDKKSKNVGFPAVLGAIDAAFDSLNL